MTTSSKTVNYTPAQEKAIVSRLTHVTDYTGQKLAVADLSVALEKSVRSISAKISTMSRSDKGVSFHKKPANVTKTGSKVQSKNDLVELIADRIGITSDKIESLEKATKNTLSIVLANLVSQEDQEELNQLIKEQLEEEDLPAMLQDQAI